MKCSRCGRELTEKQSYVYLDNVMCEDCFMDIGLSNRECDPWATYVDTSDRKRHGLTSTEGLTQLEKAVYEFVKSRGRTTREEVVKSLGLSEKELESQLLPLMHSELIKEQGKDGEMYLIPIN